MVGMKFSLMMMERICFQSVVLSPSSRQMDSSASFTAAGGLAMDRTSTRCCFLIDFTAEHGGSRRGGAGGRQREGGEGRPCSRALAPSEEGPRPEGLSKHDFASLNLN